MLIEGHPGPVCNVAVLFSVDLMNIQRKRDEHDNLHEDNRANGKMKETLRRKLGAKKIYLISSNHNVSTINIKDTFSPS